VTGRTGGNGCAPATPSSAIRNTSTSDDRMALSYKIRIDRLEGPIAWVPTGFARRDPSRGARDPLRVPL
jgi:hypothetical protein